MASGNPMEDMSADESGSNAELSDAGNQDSTNDEEEEESENEQGYQQTTSFSGKQQQLEGSSEEEEEEASEPAPMDTNFLQKMSFEYKGKDNNPNQYGDLFVADVAQRRKARIAEIDDTIVSEDNDSDDDSANETGSAEDFDEQEDPTIDPAIKRQKLEAKELARRIRQQEKNRAKKTKNPKKKKKVAFTEYPGSGGTKPTLKKHKKAAVTAAQGSSYTMTPEELAQYTHQKAQEAQEAKKHQKNQRFREAIQNDAETVEAMIEEANKWLVMVRGKHAKAIGKAANILEGDRKLTPAERCHPDNIKKLMYAIKGHDSCVEGLVNWCKQEMSNLLPRDATIELQEIAWQYPNGPAAEYLISKSETDWAVEHRQKCLLGHDSLAYETATLADRRFIIREGIFDAIPISDYLKYAKYRATKPKKQKGQSREQAAIAAAVPYGCKKHSDVLWLALDQLIRHMVHMGGDLVATTVSNKINEIFLRLSNHCKLESSFLDAITGDLNHWDATVRIGQVLTASVLGFSIDVNVLCLLLSNRNSNISHLVDYIGMGGSPPPYALVRFMVPRDPTALFISTVVKPGTKLANELMPLAKWYNVREIISHLTPEADLENAMVEEQEEEEVVVPKKKNKKRKVSKLDQQFQEKKRRRQEKLAAAAAQAAEAQMET